jgi:hypothetical protein
MPHPVQGDSKISLEKKPVIGDDEKVIDKKKKQNVS